MLVVWLWLEFMLLARLLDLETYSIQVGTDIHSSKIPR